MSIHIQNAKSYFSEVAKETINNNDQKLIHKLAFGLSELSLGIQDLDERIEAIEKTIISKS